MRIRSQRERREARVGAEVDADGDPAATEPAVARRDGPPGAVPQRWGPDGDGAAGALELERGLEPERGPEPGLALEPQRALESERGLEPEPGLESEVRMYSRCFPARFERAQGAHMYAADGRSFVDFFCGAGSLNYGHNPEPMKRALIEHLAGDGLVQGLDMDTVARRRLLEAIGERLLAPRGLDYRVQFCAPAGTNAVEAALRLARKVTGRSGVVAFTGAFHGMSAASMSASGSGWHLEDPARVPGVTFVPFEWGPDGHFDVVGYLERILGDPQRGMELPAAVILEPVQIEAGVYAASEGMLRGLRELTERHGVLLICDEVQAGCGRTGPFFGFERAGIVPDIVAVAKSIGGCGLPLALTLFRSELDAWTPGEVTGTFRGNQLAFVAGAAALELWDDPAFLRRVEENAARMARFAREMREREPLVEARGSGMLLGLDLAGLGHDAAAAAQRTCFESGLLVERCGRGDHVLKAMPPLAIDRDSLEFGLEILGEAVLAAAPR